MSAEVMRASVVVMLALAVLRPHPVEAQTLRDAIVHDDIPAPGNAADLDRPITSFAVLDTTDLFVIAYYHTEADSSFGDSLRIRTFEKAARTWRHTVLPRMRPVTERGEDTHLGSVTRITGTDPYICLDTHLTPSAGRLLVLTRELSPVAALDGWVQRVLSDGFVVYQRSMVHFAPTHSAELWGFDPASSRDALIYPQRPYAPIRTAYIEQVAAAYRRLGEAWFRDNNHHMDAARFDSSVIGPVIATGSDAIEFVIRFGSIERALPVALPVLVVVVTCSGIRTSPRCTERERR